MRDNNRKMLFITCEGAPRELGRQYGEQAKDSIRKNLDYFGAKWDLARSAMFLNVAKQILSEKLPEVLAEFEGMSEGADVSLERLLLFNFVETCGDRWLQECTPIAVSDSDDGPILGKNDDGTPVQPQDYVTRTSYPEHGLPLIQMTYAGWLSGLDSMNAEGLANGHGSVGSVFDKSGLRVDIRLWAYRLMRTCHSTVDFVRGMMDGNLTGKGFAIVLVDRKNVTSVLDAAVPLIAERSRNEKMVYATNLYMSDALKNADMRKPEAKFFNTCRYGYLRWVEQTGRTPKNIGEMGKLLSSHDPYAPCRHGDGLDKSVTSASYIAISRNCRFLSTAGNPCENPYREVKFR